MNEQDKNNIFFVCSIIEYLGRKTKNRRSDIVKLLGKVEIERQIELAEVNHCLPMEQVADELIEVFHISEGSYDSVGKCRYPVPSVLSIAKNYQRLIINDIQSGKIISDAFSDVFQSYISDEISDFNSSVYYSSPEYLKVSYEEGKLVK
jgi:hypothetical protein